MKLGQSISHNLYKILDESIWDPQWNSVRLSVCNLVWFTVSNSILRLVRDSVSGSAWISVIQKTRDEISSINKT